MDEQEIIKVADELLPVLEEENGESLHEQIHQIPRSDRLAVARRLKEIFKPQAGSSEESLPVLTIEPKPLNDGMEILWDLDLTYPNKQVDLYNPGPEDLSDRTTTLSDLFKLMVDNSWSGREAASAEILQRGGGQVVQELASAAKSHPDIEVRQRAKGMIQNLISPEKESAILRCYKIEDSMWSSGADAAIAEVQSIMQSVDQFAHDPAKLNKRLDELTTLNSLRDDGSIELSNSETRSVEQQLGDLRHINRLTGQLRIHYASILNKSGNQEGAIEALAEAMTLTPEVVEQRQFLRMVCQVEAHNNPSFLESFKRQGGSMERLIEARKKFEADVKSLEEAHDNLSQDR